METVSENNLYNDIIKDYLKDITNYPLLSEEDEFKYGENLKYGKDLKITKRVNKITNILDLNKVFLSLINMPEYKNALFFLRKIVSDKNDSTKLKKYIAYSDNLERPLDRRELFICFNEELPDEEFNFSYEELMDQLEKYLIYRDAKNNLTNSNLRLVVSIAKRYKLSNIELMDLINEGNIGLMKAVDKFDTSYNTKFSTYAVYWIQQSIKGYISKNMNSMYLTSHFREKLMIFNNAVEELENKEHRKLSAQEISELLCMNYKVVLDYLTYKDIMVSLNQPVGEDEDVDFQDLLPSDDKALEELVMDQSLSEELEKLFNALNENEKKVIKMRFGYYGRIFTLGEVAKRINVSNERIRQIESKALIKLCRQSHKEGDTIKSYLN